MLRHKPPNRSRNRGSVESGARNCRRLLAKAAYREPRHGLPVPLNRLSLTLYQFMV